MEVFNLAEELEKENKELKKEIEKITAESTEWEERTYCWQDRAEDLQIIIDKAINYIKIINEDLLKCDNFLSHDEIIEKKRLNKLLDILKGDNK